MQKKKVNNQYIYIVLVSALTGLGKFLRIFSKYEYTHIAVALNEPLNDFLTFSRRKHYAPFDSGFMHEKIDCYAFGKNKEIKLKVFKIPLSQDNKKIIEQYITNIENDKEYIFNFLSMITMPIIHGFEIYKTHNCMTFTGKIIELSKIVTLTKPYYKYNIKELDKLLTPYLYQEDYFKKEKEETFEYMQHINIIKNIWLFIKLNCKLIYRLIVKRGNKNESINI